MSAPYPVWSAMLDDVFVCVAVRRVAEDTVTVLFAPRQPSLLHFDAGQYVTIEFRVDGMPVSRCYSISSPPTRPRRLGITVKRTDDGVVSRWLHDGGLRPGDEVRIGDPQGSFTIAANPAAAYLFLTAGSGITPVLSMLREFYDLGRNVDVVVVHSQRRMTQIPYYEELCWLAEQLPGLRLRVVCTEQEERLHERMLTQLVPDITRRETFVCGPAGYRHAMRLAVAAAGVEERRVHEESYAFESADVPLIASCATVTPVDVFAVEFSDYATTVACPAGTTILDAAMAAGLDVPSSCTQGVCGTCKSTLTSGEVDMHHAGGIRPREIAAGKVLLCCSTPLTDLAIASS